MLEASGGLIILFVFSSDLELAERERFVFCVSGGDDTGTIGS